MLVQILYQVIMLQMLMSLISQLEELLVVVQQYVLGQQVQL